MTESLASPRSVPGNKAQENAGCIEIAGYRRISIFIVFAPMVAGAMVALNILAHEALSGFPDRRAIMLFYEMGFAAFLGLFLVKYSKQTLWGFNRIFIARAPALFIEGGSLIYISKQLASVPVAEGEVSLSAGDNLFQKLLVSYRGERRLAVGLMFLNRPGPEIIDAINANRFQRSG